MDGETLHPIGELARRTGLTVKTIRFYSDRGLVPPAGRSAAGHRLYGPDAVARLRLVRTLRALGLDLPTIGRVVRREATLPEVAAAHAAALEVRIRTLRSRQAVLAMAARRGSTPEEMDLMHELAELSEDARHRLVAGFLDAALGGLDLALDGVGRSLTPCLPDDPAPEQVEAWVELAGLLQDDDFRAALRRTAERFTQERRASGGGPPRRHLAATARDVLAPVLAAGTAPGSPEAGPVVAELIARYAAAFGRPDGPGLEDELLDWVETVNDPRRERYLRLLAVVNGWTPPDTDPAPALTWLTRALRRGGRPDSIHEAMLPPSLA
ncbi:MerR family transcriptional regulator [Nonomuraea pusilla]|uniref:DNA-binding transcriptional regulator, MerR family n=1 Tax=Nonomuraea pusilla TaxID=46177 RepID=A0A1H7J301_9ACTN|nr:MerR family transcriptional regulator [Nonomuraea pusilla]SEK69048.1 DNA-binding transcriptional regulator, MerR family [Nonomuraea pusilla]